jgi:hypothetical protein
VDNVDKVVDLKCLSYLSSRLVDISDAAQSCDTVQMYDARRFGRVSFPCSYKLLRKNETSQVA